jgi:Zn-dependent metalloprotease
MIALTVLTVAEAGHVRQLVDATGGTARVSLHGATGAVRFIRLDPGSLALDGATPAQRATDFLARHGSVMGISDPATELDAPDVRVDRYGTTRVSYHQVYRGLPVFAGVVRAHFDANGELTAVNGTFVPGIDVDPRPMRHEAEASAIAVADVLSRLPAPPAIPVEPWTSRLVVFRSGLVQRVEGRDHLTWEVEVGNGHDVREIIFIDAHTGKIVERIEGIHHILDRKIHEGELDSVIIWSEGDPLPYDSGDSTNDDQVNSIIDSSGGTYDLFANLSGGTYLSWDGASGTLHSVWKATALNCPNASWNGTSTNFCDGVAGDDVVAHEWAHAYTQKTHGLIYQWQPGALNESYSDVFGDVLDLINGAGTDSPDATRVSGDCSTHGGSPPPSLEVLSPPAIAGSYVAGGANFNPAPPISATAVVEQVDDGDDSGGTSVTDACQPLVGFTAGRIALIDRGECSFASKVKRAQNAGAVGAIIVNYQDSAFNMSGTDPSITIPAVMVSSSDGQTIEDHLGSGVTATIALDASTADSVRWLVGEDCFGFGGAIRDMWNPRCFGDPAKVSDPLYHCGTSDGGGVHTNSGVPNHGFTLLVDGGSFNGQTVSGIGLTKAAHIYWRAMSIYQVPDSDFADHADALAQSCGDLIGINLADLSSGAPSGQSLTVADCDQVTHAMSAMEMTEDPPCDFSPLLDPNEPPFGCGAVGFFDGFEDDPTTAWTLSNSGVFPEYTPRDWEWTSEVPEGGTGRAFFAVDSRVIGNCVEGDDDQSGMMSLESPSITLGGEASLAFDHWVATEAAYDGGNLKISVNGGAFQLVGPADFLFNAYNTTLQTSDNGNTNPMAGEDAFSGSNGGQVTGSWGQSQVDLGSYADAGDTIRLRFDLGVDGCNGLVGWYVDNVLVCTSENGSGWVPDGATVPGTQLTLEKSGSNIALTWGDSCVASDSDYAVYEGTLGSFDTHTPRFCTTFGATTMTFAPASGSSYYLVVPQSVDREGSYGTDGAGNERPRSGSACLPQALALSCD